jgi:hypothetical protein
MNDHSAHRIVFRELELNPLLRLLQFVDNLLLLPLLLLDLRCEGLHFVDHIRRLRRRIKLSIYLQNLVFVLSRDDTNLLLRPPHPREDSASSTQPEGRLLNWPQTPMQSKMTMRNSEIAAKESLQIR